MACSPSVRRGLCTGSGTRVWHGARGWRTPSPSGCWRLLDIAPRSTTMRPITAGDEANLRHYLTALNVETCGDHPRTHATLDVWKTTSSVWGLRPRDREVRDPARSGCCRGRERLASASGSKRTGGATEVVFQPVGPDIERELQAVRGNGRAVIAQPVGYGSSHPLTTSLRVSPTE